MKTYRLHVSKPFMIFFSGPLTILARFSALALIDYTAEQALVLLAHLVYFIFSCTSSLMGEFSCTGHWPSEDVLAYFCLLHRDLFRLVQQCCTSPSNKPFQF